MKFVRLNDLPASLGDLAADAEREGHRFLGRLTREWESGLNRFDRPGEALFAALEDDRLVGVGGLSVDPYENDSRVGRVRHLYVLPEHRRQGVGRSLMGCILAEAWRRFDCLHLRTHNPVAARFYQRFGFRPCVGSSECTHVLNRLPPLS